jgi:hypothetical protein
MDAVRGNRHWLDALILERLILEEKFEQEPTIPALRRSVALLVQLRYRGKPLMRWLCQRAVFDSRPVVGAFDAALLRLNREGLIDFRSSELPMRPVVVYLTERGKISSVGQLMG